MRGWQSRLRRGLTVGLAIALSLSLMACGGTPQRTARPTGKDSASLVGRLSEVSPPSLIQELRQELDQYQPQVKILSPRADEVLQAQEVSVRLQVRDLPIFKNPEFGLGPHLHVFLDNQPYQAVYSTDEPLVLTDLTPGTHTLRVFASRPWHESFKNEGAYAQVTFHVFAKTGEHQPLPNQPLLTYSRPQGSYGAEPVMLDFYLTNAPLHLVAQENPDDDIRDWRVKCTVNGESFLFDAWEPIYLKGVKPGKNWVQLELVDEKGVAIANAFNNTVRILNYEPGGTDTLSKLTRGELAIAKVKGIVDPNYTPPEPEPEPEPEIMPEPSPEPSLEVTSEPEVRPAPEAVPSPSPTVVPVIPMPEVSPSEPAILEEPAIDAIEKKNLPEIEPDAGPIPPSLEEPAAPEPIPVVPPPVTPVPAASAPEKPTGARGFLDRLREKRSAIQQSPTPSPVPSLEEKAPSELPKPDDLQVEEQPTSDEPAKQPAAAGLEEQLPKLNEPGFEAVQPTRGPKPAYRSYLERFRRPVTEPSQPVPSAPPGSSPIEELPSASQSPEVESVAPADPPVPPEVPARKLPGRSQPTVSAPNISQPPVSPSPEAVRPVPLPVVTPTPEVEQNPEESLEDRIKRAVEERRRARLGQSVPTP